MKYAVSIIFAANGKSIYCCAILPVRACEKKSVNSVFYDYIFTYPAL